LREFFLYAPREELPAESFGTAEPPPPSRPDEAIDEPAGRLDHSLRLQRRVVQRLEQDTPETPSSKQALHDRAEILTVLNATTEAGDELIHAHRLLLAERNLLRAERDQLAATLRLTEALSLTDELTGLPNRRAFAQRLEQELSRSQRTAQPLVLVMLDIDHFKDVNDHHGHYAGDMILRCYAQCMLRELRQHDLLARYGGEEFALLLPETQTGEAENVVAKLSNRLRREPIEAGDVCITLPTFSAGITTQQPGDTALSLINRADQALYCAKRHGRNRTETT